MGIFPHVHGRFALTCIHLQERLSAVSCHLKQTKIPTATIMSCYKTYGKVPTRNLQWPIYCPHEGTILALLRPMMRLQPIWIQR